MARTVVPIATVLVIELTRGVHRSTRELEDAIRRYVVITNAAPKPFVWNKTADEILDSTLLSSNL